ncbi:hypothetical protein pEaSNUABM37_00141 [Erwinia phage pEa_SNUABM_37]|nr:hypothetical protein pEaSNUABM37_00141 [Erwinia phage pEa_SNUABM_37]QXO10611.1 hypothetical protein pEaSNUABM48_00141 [Erwinia phage pEa_SNUABM_48]
MNIDKNKLAFIMSEEFVSMVREDLNTMGVKGVCRMAERRYQYRNPKMDGIEITVEDIKRAVGMSYGIVTHKDRLVNIYTWIVSNVRNFFGGVKATKEAVADAWVSYRKYVSDNGLERLWAGAGITDRNSIVEREFRIICSNVAEKI